MSNEAAPDPLVVRLRAAGCVFAEHEAAALRDHAAGDVAALERMVTERVGGRPLEQVVGHAELDGVRVRVAPGVFVPRRRSLLLVRLATAHAAPGGVAVDLCCGTGALGLLLARRRPDLEAHAADVDAAAVAVARRNLGDLEAARPDAATRVHHGDLFAALPGALRGRVAALVVNAPYVPSEAIARMPPEARDHEPVVALDGGRDGLDVHRRVAAEAGSWLTPGGLVVVETSRVQADRTAALLADAGLAPVIHTDDDLDATAVQAVRGSSTTSG